MNASYASTDPPEQASEDAERASKVDAAAQVSNDASGNHALAALSKEIVRIYKEQFGRGPTKVRSHYAGPDTVMCVLENTFTPAEKNLQGMGEHQRLREMRMFFQYASAGEFTEAVKSATGRQVRSFISGIDTNSDIACEVFVLEPQTPS
jgi:uncharacterized protein YbcI